MQGSKQEKTKGMMHSGGSTFPAGIASAAATASLHDSSVYTDLRGLNSIRQLGQEDSPEALRQIAIQFESIFLNMMLKEMRKGEESLFADNYLRSNEMSFHRDNLDNQLALHMASEGGIGLADALHRQLLRHYRPEYNTAPGGELTPTEQARHVGAAAYRDIGRLERAAEGAQP